MRRAFIFAAILFVPGVGAALAGLAFYTWLRDRQKVKLAKQDAHRQVAEELVRLRARVPEERHWGSA